MSREGSSIEPYSACIMFLSGNAVTSSSSLSESAPNENMLSLLPNVIPGDLPVTYSGPSTLDGSTCCRKENPGDVIEEAAPALLTLLKICSLVWWYRY